MAHHIRQNIQDDLQPLSAFLVALCTVLKIFSDGRGPKSRFSWCFDVSFRLLHKRQKLNSRRKEVFVSEETLLERFTELMRERFDVSPGSGERRNVLHLRHRLSEKDEHEGGLRAILRRLTTVDPSVKTLVP
jgi:hypothetical protein